MKFDWDPEIETPATIAVVGGGPTGVEAALYARFLGYTVMLFDDAKVGDSLLCWGEQKMPSASQPAATWSEVTSSLGLAAIEAQSGLEGIPPLDTTVSYRHYVEKYLLPLARTDLLHESIHVHSPVISISRLGCARESEVPLPRRAEQEFRLLIQAKNRGEYSQLADIVLDCSGLSYGTFGLATGGGLAVGERQCRPHLLAGRRDILGRENSHLAGKHILLFGNNFAACCNALDVQQLVELHPQTRLTWILPKHLGASKMQWSVSETPANAGVLELSRGLLANTHPQLAALQAWGIEALSFDEQGWKIRLQTTEDETLDLVGDVLINCSQPVADWSHACSLPLGGWEFPNCQTLEPHYYVLGQKSKGVQAELSFPEMRQQIREVFAWIGGRAELDLYASVRSSRSTG